MGFSFIDCKGIKKRVKRKKKYNFMQKSLSYIPISVLFSVIFLFSGIDANAQPSLEIWFDATGADGATVEHATEYEGSAPIDATFYMKVTNGDGWDMKYEWRVCHKDGNLDSPYITRYEENPTIQFASAGTDSIALYATFERWNASIGEMEVIEFKREYYTLDATPLTIKASESELIFPNAFSPNGDGVNDFFKPKSFKSIVEFRAIIFNRWGQKLYEWNDVTAEGWDGSYHGRQVKQGTYFVLCNAKGADGTIFKIKKDVNILRGYTKDDPVNPEE